MANDFVDLDNKPVFSKNMIILLLAIALLGTVGYIIYEKVQHKKEITSGAETINDLERSREILKQELRLTRSEYDTAKTRIEIKDADLQSKDDIIFDKQKRIQNILNKEEITRKDLDYAKRLIFSLRTELDEYKKRIESLLIENKDLKHKNVQLKTEKDKAISTNKVLSNDLETVISEKENETSKVNATLSVSNYNLTGLKVRNSGKEIETERARRIDKLRVSFEIDPNINAIAETKEIFIAIYKPDGKLGIFDGAKKGLLPLRSGNSVEYSDRLVFNYDPSKANKISFDWRDFDFPKGNYRIDIYNNGFKIAQNTITLK